MSKNLFKNATFNYAWEINKTIKLFSKKYNIIVSADAYYESEGITEAQNDAYSYFLNEENSILNKIQGKLMDVYKNNVENRFIPTTLKVEKNGNMGLLFDDSISPDEGFVVTITPEMKILDLDYYL